MIYPSATDSTHCWDAGTPKSLTRDGGGDTQGLVQMVRPHAFPGSLLRVLAVLTNALSRSSISSKSTAQTRPKSLP